jgi:chromosome segregation ATPase
MKNSIGVIFLAVCCVALIIVLIFVNKNASEQREKAIGSISSLSNSLNEANIQLSHQRETNASLGIVIATKDAAIATKNEALMALTNNYTALGGELDKTEASLKAAKEEVTQRDAKIAQLELENLSLNERSAELSASLTNLNAQIADTKQKLATSEGDKTFLQSELKRLMAEKADLEKQFNNLAVVRAQVAKLREQLALSRRLDWMRRGIYTSNEQKGGERLLQVNPTPTFTTATNSAPPKPKHFDLNVEVNSDGSVHVISPPTNTPAKTP